MATKDSGITLQKFLADARLEPYKKTFEENNIKCIDDISGVNEVFLTTVIKMNSEEVNCFLKERGELFRHLVSLFFLYFWHIIVF